MTSKIEITFPVPVEIPKGWNSRMLELIKEVCDLYKEKNPNRTMWVFGYGDKPTYSQADAAFLGIDTPASAPDTGDPEFDNNIFMIEVAERELKL